MRLRPGVRGRWQNGAGTTLARATERVVNCDVAPPHVTHSCTSLPRDPADEQVCLLVIDTNHRTTSIILN